MKYTKYTIETTTEAEDLLSASLSEIGIEGIEITDSTPWSREELDEIFVDEVPVDPDIPEGVAYVSFYLSEEDDRDAILKDLRSVLDELLCFSEIPCGSLKVTSDDIADEDYLNSWKDYFHTFDIELKGGRVMRIIGIIFHIEINRSFFCFYFSSCYWGRCGNFISRGNIWWHIRRSSILGVSFSILGIYFRSC